jgi:hypothetical protein
LYQRDRAAFKQLFAEYRNRANPEQRAPHRLSVWLKPEDLAYKNCDDLKREHGRSLVRALDDPAYFGFSLRLSGPGAIAGHDPANREYYLQASAPAIGAITYIAFETRRLHEAMKARGEKFVPLEITALVQPLDFENGLGNGSRNGLFSHCTGQVFDIDYSNLPPGQREALDFVLKDMGWDGYVGFVREDGSKYHVGAAPTAREFFTRVYYEALAKTRQSD